MNQKVYKIRNTKTGLFYSTSKKCVWSDNPTDHAIYTEAKRCRQIITMYSKPYHSLDFADAEIVEYQLIPTTTYTFDLERMQQMVNSTSVRMPDNLTFDEFQEWMQNISS